MPESDAGRKVPESDAGRKVSESDAGRKVSESDARNLIKSAPSVEISCDRVWKKVPEGDAGRKMSENDAGRKVSESGTWNLISPFSGNQLWQSLEESTGKRCWEESVGKRCSEFGVKCRLATTRFSTLSQERSLLLTPSPPPPTFSSRLCSHASGQATISDHCRLTDLVSTGQGVTFRLRHFPWWTTT